MTLRKFALVVVDLQEDFLPPNGSLAIKGGRDIIPSVNKLINTKYYDWSIVIATQDWHPPDHCSFASQHNVSPFTELTFQHPLSEKDDAGEIKTMKQIVWPDHCIQNTVGASIDPEFFDSFKRLDVSKAVVKKGYLRDREYYSCFKDCWQIHETEVKSKLIEHEVTDVIFTGLAYDFCVLNSAIDSRAAGFKTYVVKDCCKPVYPQQIEATDETYKSNDIKIIYCRDIPGLFNL